MDEPLSIRLPEKDGEEVAAPDTLVTPTKNVDPVYTVMSLSNYKVPASWGTDPSKPKKSLLVIDTGAGPNCVRVDALSSEDRERIDTSRKANLKAANGTRITTNGVIDLYIKIKDFVARDSFIVCENLPCPVLCGNQFNDKYIKNIGPINQVVELPNGQLLEIVRVSKDWDGINSISSDKEAIELKTYCKQNQ